MDRLRPSKVPPLPPGTIVSVSAIFIKVYAGQSLCPKAGVRQKISRNKTIYGEIRFMVDPPFMLGM
jgi:hypothetical protein